MLIFIWVVEKFSGVCGKRKFDTIFTKALQFSLSCAILPHCTITFKSLYSLLYLVPPSGFFP
jgi:hypothetical protein